MIYVTLYLIAIVAANLLVARFGPSVAVANAFLFIGLDLTARDALHDAWRGRVLWPRMAALIACGSLLSYTLNRNAGPIALASFAAFACAGAADALMYHRLGRWRQLWRVNGSNVGSAVVDSFVFVLLAFGPAMWYVVPLQVAAKVAGGFAWSVMLVGLPWLRRRVA